MDALRADVVDKATGEAVRVFSWAQLGKKVLGAMGQMFYSLSLAMGIMITYGSYMRKEDSIEKCVRRIEIFDTLIAVVAGLMIIPVVYMFAVKSGIPVKEAMNAGPGLMFTPIFSKYSSCTFTNFSALPRLHSASMAIARASSFRSRYFICYSSVVFSHTFTKNQCST